MKFWNHQENARSETRRLLLGFAVAVALLVAAVAAGAAGAAWSAKARGAPITRAIVRASEVRRDKCSMSNELLM